jgi:hypothetical protein
LEELLKIAVQAMGSYERESFEQARSVFAPIKAISAGAEAFDKGADSVSGTLFVLIENE